MNSLDWNLLRSFVAVAEEGSLSAAARALGSSQPTLGRHVAELEDALGIGLFVRHARGLRLTDEGAKLYEVAAGVRAGVDDFARRATGLDPGLDGTVRVTASEVVAVHVLPGVLATLRATHPGIQLEVVADNRAANLLRRDADVAIRMFRPAQPDLITRHVADAQLGLYASAGYVARYGAPRGLQDLRSHTFLGFDRDDLHLRTLQARGVVVARDDFPVRCDNQLFHIHATLAGLGIGGVQTAIAARLQPTSAPLVAVMPELELPALPLWLVAHAELRRSPRVRAVYDALAEGLRAFYADEPEAGVPSASPL